MNSLSRNRLRVLVLALAALATVGCDQVSKAVAADMLATGTERSLLFDVVRLVYAENQGGFLSLGAGLSPVVRTIVFSGLTALGLVALTAFAVRRRRVDGLATLGLVLLISGGFSNWIDRVVRGSVVDFLNVGVGWLRTGIFNIADVAIMVGALIFLFGEWRTSERKREELT